MFNTNNNNVVHVGFFFQKKKYQTLIFITKSKDILYNQPAMALPQYCDQAHEATSVHYGDSMSPRS